MIRMVIGSSRRIQRPSPQVDRATSPSGSSSSSSSASSCLATPDDDDNGGQNSFLEPWVEWIKRTTREAEERVRRLHLCDWVDSHKKAVVKWLRRMRGDERSWARRVYLWEPSHLVRRPVGPRKRWSDAAENFP